MEKGAFLGNPGHLNLILEQTIDQSSNFDSALSSLVSSPSSNPPPSNGDSLVIHELIGRLGSICNSHQSANNSCYSTPLNSPPKLNLSIASHPAHMALPARCLNFGCKGMPSGGVSQEESSGSGNAKKRKATTKGKGKEAPLSSTITAASISPKKAGAGGLNAKRSKLSEETGVEDQSTKTSEASKDYIHVRARRGQATDSHSLAERVRREKISERMKLLQDLVPGCSKVTGKAVMLDEIINYVQLLQRQVEFLSMKLATSNPLLDFSMENFVAKDIEVHQNCGTLPPHAVYPLEAPSSSFSFASLPERTPTLISINGVEMESQVNALNLGRSLSMQMPPLEGFMDASCQLGTFWDDDLRTVVQMGFNQNKENIFSSQEFQGSMTTSQMEIEL